MVRWLPLAVLGGIGVLLIVFPPAALALILVALGTAAFRGEASRG